jgi:hypothetical protein
MLLCSRVHENLYVRTDLPAPLRESANEITVQTGGVYLTASATGTEQLIFDLERDQARVRPIVMEEK